MSLGIKEMQTKITISYHFTSIRMPTLNSKTTTITTTTQKVASIDEDVEKLEHCILLEEI